MATWAPDGDNTVCLKHDQRFKRGRVCPDCTPADLEEPDTQAPAFDAGLPALSDYERKLVAIADQAIVLAGELAKGTKTVESDKGEPLNIAAKMLDTGIKALRAGMDLARYREDWGNLFKLKALVAELKARRGPARTDEAPH